MRPFTICFTLLAAFLAQAIPAQETPSINPVANQDSKKNVMPGFAGMSKDRPKDAKTEITASQEATFDNATSIAEFTGNVVVHDPQFTLTCDKLKVTLSKNRKGMEIAEATGHVIIIQENTDSKGHANKAIGHAGAATYVPLSGEVTLRIWPSIQQGINNQVATEESTIMVLNRSGKSNTKGGSKTSIVDTGAANPPQ